MSQGSNAVVISQGGGGATSFNELIGTVPAGACLTKVNAQVQLSAASVAITYAVGAFESLNLMTGIQWVAHGGTPATVNVSPFNAGSWLTMNDDPRIIPVLIQGVQGTNYVAGSIIGIVEQWRGQFDVPQSLDIYWSFGEDTNLTDTVNYRAFGNAFVEWATWP